MYPQSSLNATSNVTQSVRIRPLHTPRFQTKRFRCFRDNDRLVGDSDCTDEGLTLEELRERISRRKLVAIAIGLVGGRSLLTGQPDRDEHLTRGEDRLAELATRINDVDVVNPQQSWRLHDDVTTAVETVNETLRQESSADSETKRRIVALTAAVDYYTELGGTLGTATNLLTQLAESEIDVLNHEEALEYVPAAEFDTVAFRESIARLSKAEKESAAVTARGQKLVPDQHRVIDALRSQRDVYELHITTQQTYLDTGTAIEAGMRALEQSHFDRARPVLTEVRDSLTSGTPTTNYRYRLFASGLSLDQYATLLALRRKGVTKLLNGCAPSLSVQQRQAVSNEAVDLFFEARRVVTRRATETA